MYCFLFVSGFSDNVIKFSYFELLWIEAPGISIGKFLPCSIMCSCSKRISVGLLFGKLLCNIKMSKWFRTERRYLLAMNRRYLLLRFRSTIDLRCCTCYCRKPYRWARACLSIRWARACLFIRYVRLKSKTSWFIYVVIFVISPCVFSDG